MAFTDEKAACVMVAVALLPAATAMAAEIHFAAGHAHRYKGCRGELTVNEEGISYHGAKTHDWHWSYRDIQEVKLGTDSIRILTYEDRTYNFEAEAPAAVYALWQKRLDQRFVAEIADRQATPEWRIAAKHLTRMNGSQGVLEICPDRIIYRTDREDDSRTWRFSDIDNISSSGPFQLTITSFERARFHYGDRKGFNFQLKEALSEARYDDLWREINQQHGKLQTP
jgi:hypothetical protein